MKYIYKGEMTGVTLLFPKKDKEGKEITESREIVFYDGKEYELPESNKYIKTLVAQKRLIPPEKFETKTPEDKKEK